MIFHYCSCRGTSNSSKFELTLHEGQPPTSTTVLVGCWVRLTTTLAGSWFIFVPKVLLTVNTRRQTHQQQGRHCLISKETNYLQLTSQLSEFQSLDTPAIYLDSGVLIPLCWKLKRDKTEGCKRIIVSSPSKPSHSCKRNEDMVDCWSVGLLCIVQWQHEVDRRKGLGHSMGRAKKRIEQGWWLGKLQQRRKKGSGVSNAHYAIFPKGFDKLYTTYTALVNYCAMSRFRI